MATEFTADDAAVLERHILQLREDCNEHVNGTCYTLACLMRGGYKREMSTKERLSVRPTCGAKEQADALSRALTVIEELRADLAEWKRCFGIPIVSEQGYLTPSDTRTLMDKAWRERAINPKRALELEAEVSRLTAVWNRDEPRCLRTKGPITHCGCPEGTHAKGEP